MRIFVKVINCCQLYVLSLKQNIQHPQVIIDLCKKRQANDISLPDEPSSSDTIVCLQEHNFTLQFYQQQEQEQCCRLPYPMQRLSVSSDGGY